MNKKLKWSSAANWSAFIPTKPYFIYGYVCICKFFNISKLLSLYKKIYLYNYIEVTIYILDNLEYNICVDIWLCNGFSIFWRILVCNTLQNNNSRICQRFAPLFVISQGHFFLICKFFIYGIIFCTENKFVIKYKHWNYSVDAKVSITFKQKLKFMANSQKYFPSFYLT